MHAIDFYICACKCVMQAKPDVPETWADLKSLLPCLRQSLGCYVCCNLLQDPVGPNHNVCKHSVCRKCQGGKMKLKPSCSWCKEQNEFVANPLLNTLVTCFAKLCVYIYNSPLMPALSSINVNGEANSLCLILKEGMEYKDDFVAQSFWMPSIMQDTVQIAKDIEMQSSETEAVVNDDEFADISDSELTDAHSHDLQSHVDSETADKMYVTSENLINAPKQSIGIRSTRNKRKPIKAIIFQKKSSENKRKCNTRKPDDVLILKSHNEIKLKKLKKMKLRHNNKLPSQSLLSNLVKRDNPEHLLKKVKIELIPTDLEQLNTCNCGKSGNFNQLTCIGQRCPCYSMKLPCIACKCKGCRNPKKGLNCENNNTNCSYAILRSGTRTTTESLCANT